MEHPIVLSTCYDTETAKITMAGVLDRPGAMAAIFRCVANAGIQPDLVQTVCPAPGLHEVTLVVADQDVRTAVAALGRARPAIGYTHLGHDTEIGTVALSGAALRARTRIIAQFFESFSRGGIPVELVSATDTRITAVTRRQEAARAARALAMSFGLGRDHINSLSRQSGYRLTEA
ncbi:ACT domain-containing protein [Streptomyces sp. NPDC101151]|uniref:ACT domain-containing protein n=1 Tax=Streptomyces sp. NPDC101151 TaxID=3366115 RepID=UPI0037FA6C44